MAEKKKAASKPKKAAPNKSDAAKAAERDPVEVHAAVLTDEDNSVIVLDVDGSQSTLDEQTLLNLRREVNEIAAGFVH